MKKLNLELAKMLISIQERRRAIDLEVRDQEDLDILLEKIQKHVENAYSESFKL